jgi:cytochrome c oxidase subunit 1
VEALAARIAHPKAAELETEPGVVERRIGWLFGVTGLALFAVMGLLGLAMRLTQADVLGISPSWFYRLLTLHGAGMLTGALLAMMGGLWFVLRPSVPLRTERALWAYAAIVGGAVAVVVAALAGGFATGWTFLYPLPFRAAGEWGTWATVTFLGGMTLVGVGFFLFCLDVLTAVLGTYGGLVRSLGLRFLAGRDDSPPPPQAIAATVVTIEGALASAVGTTMLMALFARTIDSGVEIDALWAKNLTYFFGHSIANLIIYLAAGMIYVLVPRYAGRPWKTTKPLVAGWMATLLLVATAYSHHLYMDFVQPGWAQYVSTTASFSAALPVAVVTIFTGMMLVWGSRYRWTLASTLLYLGFAGWAIGGTGAVIDSVIPVNFRLHNTLWVPAHFHTYLMLGVIFWLMAFVVHLVERAAGRPASRFATIAAPALMVVGGYGLVGSWYLSGALGEPRRYAVQLPGTEGYSVAGSVAAGIFALGFLVLLAELWSLGREALRRRAAGGAPGPGAEPAVAPVEPAPALASPIADDVELGSVVTLATLALAAFLPVVVDASEAGTQWHHLDHAAQFAFGALLGIALGSGLEPLRRRLGRGPSAAAIWVVILAPTAMLLAMVPDLYGSLEDRELLHSLYHLGMAALGLATGLAAAGLGRAVGRIVIVLSIGMSVMYAAGVSGG